MENFRIAFYVFNLISVAVGTPFIFDDSIHSCFNVTKEGKKLEMNSQTLEIKEPSLTIFFKLCGKFDKSDESCPAGTIGCLLDRTGKQHILGKELVFEEEHLLHSKDGDACSKGKAYTLVVRFQLSKEAPSLTKNDGCTFHIDMMHPAFKFNCGINLYGRFLDLTPLKRSFQTYNKKVNKTFSVTLCQQDKSCGGTDISACIIESTLTPLATTSTVLPYSKGKNQIIFRGSYKGNESSSNKKLEVILKCNWEKREISDNDFRYLDKHIQGKLYSFELETSYGCIKKPVPCILHEEFLIYNLSGLHSKDHVNGEPQRNNSKYFLQICGAVELSGKNNSCKSTHAQVCENLGDTDINRGSVLSGLEVTNDGLKATIDHGMQCEKANKSLYQTVVYLHCDYKDYGPKLFNQTDCVTYFHWRTPFACPKYNSSSCSYILRDSVNNNCIFQVDNRYYNLSVFNNTLEVEDQNSPNLQYKINICGSVLEKEAPCLKDVSVTRKNSSEPHIKHRIISLGKFLESTLKNDSLVLTFGTGSWSAEYRGDCSSEIHFVCSDSEEKPKLVNQTKCHYEFLWRTKYGCPRIADVNKKLETLYNEKNCSFTNNSTGQSVELGFVKPITFSNDMQRLSFHICGRFYTNCSQEPKACTNTSLEHSNLTVSKNGTTLEVKTPKRCFPERKEFNKVLFHFICDTVREISNNDHIKFWNIEECQVNIYYTLESICYLQYIHNSTEDSAIIRKPTRQSDVKVPDHIYKETVDNDSKLIKPLPKQNHLEKCSIKSPFTDHILNIRNLTNVLDFFKDVCPSATFNDSFRYVRLLYPSTDVCRPNPSRNISYELFLVCSSDVKVSPVNEDCLQHFNHEGHEYCDFFKPLTHSNRGIIISSVVVCLLAFGLLFLGCWARKRGIYWNRSRNGFLMIYERNAEL